MTQKTLYPAKLTFIYKKHMLLSTCKSLGRAFWKMADMSPNLELESGYWKKGYSISRWHNINKSTEMGKQRVFSRIVLSVTNLLILQV